MAEKKSKTTKTTKKSKPATVKQKALTPREKAFCRAYIKSGNGNEAVRKAGYKPTTDSSASSIASRLLRRDAVKAEITRLNERKDVKAIADAQQVMEFLTKVMNGEVLDQFGLDASLNDRLKAAQELAKRTVDIDNRVKGVPDNTVTIKVDWKKD